MGDIYYLGVPSGNGSRGSLVFPDAGKSFHAGSGSTSAYRAPDGTYDIGKREWGEQDVSLGKAKYKYRITGVTKNGTKAAPGHAWDPNKGKHGEMRSKLLIHPDGGKAPGTSGCIGVRGTPTAWGNANPADNSADVAAAQEVDQLLGSGKYDRVIVKTFKNVEEMEAFQKQIAPDAPMKRPDEKKPDPPPGQICTMVVKLPYAEIVAEKETFSLGGASDGCGSNSFDLCGEQAEVLQGFIASIKANYKSFSCPQ